MAARTPDNQRLATTAKVWGIWVPLPGVLPLPTLRTNRRDCIKEYTAFYTARTRPKLTWSQLYRWGWRCIPVTVSFHKPRYRSPESWRLTSTWKKRAATWSSRLS